MNDPGRPSIHANAVVVGEAGVLVRGPSGAGKSSFSIALIDEARGRGHYGALVADDRVFLSAEHGRLVARGAPGFDGLIEQRGEGLIRLQSEPSTRIRIVVDLASRDSVGPRWPEDDERRVEMLGVGLPRLLLDFSRGFRFAALVTLRKLDLTASGMSGNW